MQTADHCDRQAPSPVQNLGDARPRPDNALQILAGEALLLHPKFYGLDRIWGIDWMVLILIGVDQGRQDIEPIPFRGTRRCAPQPLDVAQIGFKALPVALLGGLESIRGALLAGIIIGLGEVFAMSYLDPISNGTASGILPYAVMIMVLFIRPQGLFGWKKIERL